MSRNVAMTHFYKHFFILAVPISMKVTTKSPGKVHIMVLSLSVLRKRPVASLAWLNQLTPANTRASARQLQPYASNLAPQDGFRGTVDPGQHSEEDPGGSEGIAE